MDFIERNCVAIGSKVFQLDPWRSLFLVDYRMTSDDRHQISANGAQCVRRFARFSFDADGRLTFAGHMPSISIDKRPENSLFVFIFVAAAAHISRSGRVMSHNRAADAVSSRRLRIPQKQRPSRGIHNSRWCAVAAFLSKQIPFLFAECAMTK